MWPIGRPPQWVGRTREVAILRACIEALGRGEGAAVWVEGEPGIGKSSLVAEALAEAGDRGWDVGWGMADQLTERLPLRVMLDCLQVRPGSPDARRARAADLLRGQRPGLLAGGDASVTGVEVLVTLVDELCAAAPTVIVVDDLQWADEASLVVWHQLAASIGQSRLLLIGTCRPTPRRQDVQQVRAAVVRRGGAVVTLGPLPETDVTALVTAIVGAPPGEALRRLTAQAAGNPLYVRELVDALVREQAVQIRPTAELSLTGEQLPGSLAAALTDRLSSVPAETAQMLRTAALFGGRFAVTDLAVVLRRPVSDLVAGLQEAAAAGILAGSGAELVFRHALIRQALYESMPTALRTALHAEAAKELAAADADVLSVAQQLSAARRPGGGWARAWLINAAPTLDTRAPQLAAELLRQELRETPAGDEAWNALVVCLVRALLAVGAYGEAVRQASRALTVMTDPAWRGETSWMLAYAQWSAGSNDDAINVIQQALATVDLPRVWQARLLALLAQVERQITGFDAAESISRRALTAAEEVGDPFATVQALHDLWLIHSVRRDHVAALDCIDQALNALGDDPGLPDLHSIALDCRTFTLQNLDDWPRAELALRQAREFAQRTG
jgi:tetratricopeptide (TPR) repeat protein